VDIGPQYTSAIYTYSQEQQVRNTVAPLQVIYALCGRLVALTTYRPSLPRRRPWDNGARQR
jgi:hypothetical protein